MNIAQHSHSVADWNRVRSPQVLRTGRAERTGLPAPVGSQGTRRSLTEVLAPLEQIAAGSVRLIARHDREFESDGDHYRIPQYMFSGPQGGDDALRIGVFAGIHGDEPEGVHALVQFTRLLEQNPEWARGYRLFLYPICNPTGFEDRTRHSRSGKDLNREFWRDSTEPEVRWLEAEIQERRFHGIISLHTDDTSHGFYGYAHGATLTRNLIEPALQAAEEFLPRNSDATIDGFAALNGVIRDSFPGVLSSPPKVRPRPFEIILETPQAAPNPAKHGALVVALQTILSRYREMMAFAPNL